MSTYLDTSAALKLVIEEAESVELSAWLQRDDVRAQIVSSMLLHTELLCAAARRASFARPAEVETALTGVELIDLERRDLLRAPKMPGRLRSADAIHLAVAVRAGCDAMLVYDGELAAAANLVGLRVIAPGKQV